MRRPERLLLLMFALLGLAMWLGEGWLIVVAGLAFLIGCVALMLRAGRMVEGPIAAPPPRPRGTHTYGTHCATCNRQHSLQLLASGGVKGTLHDDPLHQRGSTYDDKALYRCACGAIQYEHYSHDCWSPPSDEPWNMCFRNRVEDVERASALVAACKTPFETDCRCPLHELLRAEIGSRGDGVDGFRLATEHGAELLLVRLPRYG